MNSCQEPFTVELQKLAKEKICKYKELLTNIWHSEPEYLKK